MRKLVQNGTITSISISVFSLRVARDVVREREADGEAEHGADQDESQSVRTKTPP